MVTEGDIPDAYQCEDGTVELYGDGICDDGSLGTPCDSECVLENSTGFQRALEAYSDERVLLVLLFAPFVTVLTAPLLVLKFSSLSIVDKKTRSMSPIGEKANDLTNIAAGFGAVVLFFQTAWKISSSAVQDGNVMVGAAYVAGILLFTLLLVYIFYPLVWLPIYKFAKSFESHVYNLDNSLVDSKGIEVHQLNYANNEPRLHLFNRPILWTKQAFRNLIMLRQFNQVLNLQMHNKPIVDLQFTQFQKIGISMDSSGLSTMGTITTGRLELLTSG